MAYSVYMTDTDKHSDTFPLNPQPSLPRWRSHKVVEAVKVDTVTSGTNGFSFRLDDEDRTILSVLNGTPEAVRFSPMVGGPDLGYYVRYADGYESWSPTKAFEEGYTSLEDSDKHMRLHEKVGAELGLPVRHPDDFPDRPAEIERLAKADVVQEAIPGKPPADSWAHRSAGMRCRTCMWFVEKAAEASDIDKVVGRCRRRSPSSSENIGFPVVFNTDWCGDHKLDENKIEV